jgi:glucose/arabinose dehydrogenase
MQREPVVAPGFDFNIFAGPVQVPDWALPGPAGAFAGPTAMAFDSRGRLFVGTLSGRILIMQDQNDDGVADQIKQFASGLGNVLGLLCRSDRDFYCSSNIPAGVGRIIRLQDLDGDDVAETQTIIIDNLPSTGDHQTNRLRFGPDDRIYFGQGSATDNGTPRDGRPADQPLNATILAFDPDSPQLSVVATGLRNPFGIAFHPDTGDLFATDGGSGEFCGNCPEDMSPPEEVNWVVPGGDYGFPECEGTPTSDLACAGVRPPSIQYPRHLTPTSLAFYTGPQAGEFRNQLLLTLFKNLPDANNFGGDLRRLILSGDSSTTFTLQDAGFIIQFDPIDPFDGPIDTVIDPISGDIYVVRIDPVSHSNPDEHHHFIYRIHRTGSDSLPFIGPLNPQSVKTGSGLTTVSLVGKHLKPGAVVFNVTDNVQLVTRAGATIFDLQADLPANLLTSQRTITLEVRNQNGGISNQQTIQVTPDAPPPPPPPDPTPQINSMFVFKKKRSKVINPVRPVDNAKKFRLVVAGADFDSGAQLLVNGAALQLESSSAGELVGRFGRSMLSASGESNVQVRNGSGKVSNIVKLIIQP